MHALDSSRLPFNHHKLRQMALATSVSLRLKLIIEADYPVAEGVGDWAVGFAGRGGVAVWRDAHPVVPLCPYY